MRAERVSPQRQYELIMECRSSGMTDSQWCLQHGIKPGTFYNWISRLRKKSCLDIPEPASGMKVIPSPKQEVVKLEIMPETNPAVIDSPSKDVVYNSSSSIEVTLGKATIRLSNDANPVLAKQIIQSLGDFLC